MTRGAYQLFSISLLVVGKMFFFQFGLILDLEQILCRFKLNFIKLEPIANRF